MRKPLIDPTRWPRTTMSSATAASHLRLFAEQKRTAMNVALNLAVDLDLAFRGDVACDRQVFADDRRDHLAPTQAETFGSESFWQGLLRIGNAFNQFSHTLARLGLRREHRRTSSSQTETQRLGTDPTRVRNSYATLS